jgi:hypothetical protein
VIIIYKSKQTFGDVLMQRFTFRKNLLKYNKVNSMILVNTHVQITHPKLFIQRKQHSREKTVEPIIPI